MAWRRTWARSSGSRPKWRTTRTSASSPSPHGKPPHLRSTLLQAPPADSPTPPHSNFDAPEAAHLGLVSRVVPGGRAEVLAAALATARLIASKSPVATLATKQFLNFARDHSVQDGLEQAQMWNMASLQPGIPSKSRWAAGLTVAVASARCAWVMQAMLQSEDLRQSIEA